MLVFATKMIDGGWIDESQRKVVSCESIILPFCFMQSQSVVHCIYNWQYVVLSSGRRVIFENGKTYNRPVAIVIVLKRMKNLPQAIKAKNDNWTDLLVFRLVYGIYACACACALAMHDEKPACAHDDEQQRNVLCHQNVFSTKQTRYCCRAALHLYPFLVFSNENLTSFFFWNRSKSSCQTALIESAGTICDTWKALSLPVRLSTPSRFRSKTL